MIKPNSAMKGESRTRDGAEISKSSARFAARPARVMARSSADTAILPGFAAEPATLYPRHRSTRRQRLLLGVEVCLYHHLDQLVEIHLGLPSQNLARFAGIAAQRIYFRRSNQLGIDLHELFPVETGVSERSLHELLNTMGFTGGNHEIVGLGLLQHEPHGLNVTAGESPIAARVVIPNLHPSPATDLAPAPPLLDLPPYIPP